MLPQLTQGQGRKVSIFHKKEREHWSPYPFAWKLSPPQTMGSNYNGAKMISTWAPSMRVPVSSQGLFFLTHSLLWQCVKEEFLCSHWKLKQNHRYVGALELLYRTQSMGQIIASSQFKTYQKLRLGLKKSSICFKKCHCEMTVPLVLTLKLLFVSVKEGNVTSRN